MAQRPVPLPVIISFTGEYDFLSNFYPCVIFAPDGLQYSSVEHAYQAAKTLDLDEKRLIQSQVHARWAKKVGRKVTIRPEWDEMKVSTMLELVRLKFCDNPLRQKLIDTGNAKLIEGNWWGDQFWGIYNGQGDNWLGRILETVRDEISGNDLQP